jgi:hypothetical protein
MSELAPATRDLLRAARADGPSAAARDAIWSEVAGATGAATAALLSAKAGGAGAGAGAAGVGGGKLVALGALFGSVVTAGIAALVIAAGAPDSGPMEAAPRATNAAAPGVGDGVGITSQPRAEAFTAPHDPAVAAAARAPATTPSAAPVAAAAAFEDPLVREAKLVAEARGALRRGEPEHALGAARAARAVAGAQLEPESRAIEIGALRALGRDDDAMAAELEMRRRFPDHALAR